MQELPKGFLDPCRAVVLASLRARRQYTRAIARRGRHPEALVLQEQLVREFKTEFGNADVDTLEAMSDLVSTYHAVWEQEKAEQLARKLLVLQENTFGVDSPISLATESMIARILHARGRYLEAMELCQRILERRQKTAGLRDMAAVAEATAAYGQSLLMLEKYSEAETVLRDALKLYDCPYDFLEGDRHLDILDCKESLAETLFSRGSHEEAVNLGREVLESRKRSLGPLHSDTINSMSNLATYLSRAYRSEESRGLIHNAMGMSAEYLGMEHRTTLSVWSNGATIHRLLGDRDVAQALAHHSFLMSERVKTISHPDTLSVMVEFCWALGQDGRFSTARDHMAVCIRYTGEVYGWDHPLTLRRTSELCDLTREACVWKATKSPHTVWAFFRAVFGYRRAQGLTLVHQRCAGTSPTGEAQSLEFAETVFYF